MNAFLYRLIRILARAQDAIDARKQRKSPLGYKAFSVPQPNFQEKDCSFLGIATPKGVKGWIIVANEVALICTVPVTFGFAMNTCGDAIKQAFDRGFKTVVLHGAGGSKAFARWQSGRILLQESK